MIQVALDFAPGLHGHFLELVLNKYIYGVNFDSPEIFPISCLVIGPLFRTVSKTLAILRRRRPPGEPEEVLMKASGRNSAKVLDRIRRLLVLLPHLGMHPWIPRC